MLFSQEIVQKWSLLSKILFRLFFAYVIVYIVLFFLGGLLEPLLQWYAVNILHWGENFSIDSTGSGDRTFDYVKLALNIPLSIFIATTWSFLDKRRDSYNQLYYWFQVILRIGLFAAMLIYGLAKVFKGQFADHTLVQLLTPVGELSPMGLAWTFMGHSMIYNIFIGFSEILGGLLVLFRRTLTLGSLIIVGVMTHVVVMNFTYDIPVKLFSSHLLFFAILLALADSNRIINVFIKNQSVDRVNHFVVPINSAFKNILSRIRLIATFIILIAVFLQLIVQFKIRDQLKEKSNFYGIWETELFIQNGDTLPSLITNSEQWRYLIIDDKKKATVKYMADDLHHFYFEKDEGTRTFEMSSTRDSSSKKFYYRFEGDNELTFENVAGIDYLFIRFRRKPLSDFKLINRGFHWLNETTYY